MGDKGHMKYNVDTTTATVKMTSGVPFKAGEISEFSSDEEEGEDDLRRATESNTRQSYSPAGRLKDVKHSRSDHVKNPSSGGLENGLTENSFSTRLRDASGNKKPSTDLGNSPININNSIQNDSINNGSVASGVIMSGTRKGKSDSDKSKATRESNYPIYIPQAGHMKRKAESSGKSPDSKFSASSTESYSDYVAVHSSMSPREQSQLHRLSHSLESPKDSLAKPNPGLVMSNSFHTMADTTGKDKFKKNRVNPFNNDLHLDEDHFSDTADNYFRNKRNSTGSTKSSSISQGMEWWHEGAKSEVTFAELGLSEDHFSHPQGHFGLSGEEELELAIENCKEMIRDAPQDSDKQKNLVLKLVQLRIKLQEIKEGPEPVPENVKVILSHKMMLKTSRTSKYYCEKCNGSIWGMLQVWYRCTECGYRCHEKCLQQILRTCAKARVIENPTLNMDICPREDNGLACQNFRCGECRSAISFKPGQTEPRLCDYTGRYYCEYCHWNDTFIIPARVLHNWDFTPYKVCRASKQFLKLMQKKAVIRIQDVNPMLFVYVDQLNEIKKLREEMMIMKRYILNCPSAMAAKLLLLLENRQHFVESSDRYSMQDLLDAEDILLPELITIHSTWAQHIKVDCELCQGRGFCCELCGDKEVLFPFDNIAVVCAKCSYVLHRHCFAKKCICPRCERREKRKGAKT